MTKRQIQLGPSELRIGRRPSLPWWKRLLHRLFGVKFKKPDMVWDSVGIISSATIETTEIQLSPWDDNK